MPLALPSVPQPLVPPADMRAARLELGRDATVPTVSLMPGDLLIDLGGEWGELPARVAWTSPAILQRGDRAPCARPMVVSSCS